MEKLTHQGLKKFFLFVFGGIKFIKAVLAKIKNISLNLMLSVRAMRMRGVGGLSLVDKPIQSFSDGVLYSHSVPANCFNFKLVNSDECEK